MGTLIPFNGNDTSSPIVSRFYSGGNDMRGFNTRRLAPQVVQPVSGSTTEGYTVPVGGNGLFEFSFEVRYNVTGNLVLAAFVDTGFVTAQRIGRTPFPDNMLVAVGAGARYRTPIGPIPARLRLPPGHRPSAAGVPAARHLAQLPDAVELLRARERRADRRGAGRPLRLAHLDRRGVLSCDASLARWTDEHAGAPVDCNVRGRAYLEGEAARLRRRRSRGRRWHRPDRAGFRAGVRVGTSG